jgi:6-pyruvoyltetrahydropterin/6-carboxytetrahydropterin synthase
VHTITKRLEFDAGHRLLKHSGKCRNYHGHRYAVEVTLMGKLEDGMVLDFGWVKEKLGNWIDTFLDHGMILQSGDPLLPILNGEGLKVYELDVPPTAENIAAELFRQAELMVPSDVSVANLRVYETPTCWADFF